MKKSKEILNGIKHRINNITNALEVLERSNEDHSFIIENYEARLDELESLYDWIKNDL